MNQTQLECLDHAWQVGRPRGRKASWDAFAPCSWTASLWTWREEPRSRRGSDPAARATAAATAPSARTTVCVWSERTASPATASGRPSLAPFVTKVRQFQFSATPLCLESHECKHAKLKEDYYTFLSQWCHTSPYYSLEEVSNYFGGWQRLAQEVKWVVQWPKGCGWNPDPVCLHPRLLPMGRAPPCHLAWQRRPLLWECVKERPL